MMLLQPLKNHSTKGQSGDFSIAEWVAEPGNYWIPPLHRHFDCDEAWYVLHGILVFLVDGEEITARKGDAVYVSKGSAHTYKNGSPEPTRYLIFMTGKTRQLIEALHGGAQGLTMKEVFAAHGAELL